MDMMSAKKKSQCPTCGHEQDEPKGAGVLEIEIGPMDEDDGDEEISAKDEVLKELMDQLSDSLGERLKKKLS